MNKNPKKNFDWEEKLITFYYTALESYVDRLELSERLKDELDGNIDDDYFLLAQFLALATKKFLMQEGWLNQDEDWDLLFPPSPYIH